MKAKFLSGRLFLEGVEVPVASATWAGTVGADSQLSVQVPYTDKIVGLRPRTLCHYFWVDSDYGEPMFGFTGDLIAMAVVRQETGNQIVLNFVGHTSYWSSTYLFNITGLGKAGKEIAYFVGAKTVTSGGGGSIFGGGTSKLYSKLVRILSSPSRSFPKLKGVLGGILHLMEYVGGWYHGRHVFRGYNDFTSLAELRLKLMQQVLASETDSSAVLLLKKKGLRDWAKNVIGQRGSMVNFGQLLNQFFQFIFYVRAPIFAGPYFPPGGEKKTKTTRVRYGLSDEDAKKVERLIYIIGELLADLGVSKRYYTISVGNAPSRYFNKMNSLFSKAEELESSINLPKSYQPCIPRAHQIYRSGATSARLARAPDRAWAETCSQIIPILKRCQAFLERLLRQKRGYKTVTKSWVEEKPDRLGCVGVWPELIFSPPPRFNVLFPEFILSFQYNRQFIQEPTRLMLRAQTVRSHDIFSGGYSKLKAYFAPDVPNIRGKRGIATAEFAKSVMNHERFTGIIPTQVQIPWANAYRIKAKGKSEYIQRLANYEYLKRRYQNRTASIRAAFRPQLVPGLPALVMVNTDITDDQLRKYLEAKGEDDRDKVAEAIAPDQYLGYITSVQHVMSPNNTGTMVSMTHVRTQREQEEDLGPGEKTIKVRDGSKTVQQKDTHFVKVVIENRVPGDRKQLISKYSPLKSSEIINITKMRRAYGVEKGVFIIEMHQGKIRSRWGTWIGAEQTLATDITGKILRRAGWGTSSIKRIEGTVYRVEVGVTKNVKVPIFKEKKEKMSFEEMVTPPWLDKKWHPENISDTYDSLFGCGSILDGFVLFYPQGEPQIVDNAVMGQEKETISVRTAVNRLSILHALASKINSVQFAEIYAERSMATMENVFGSPDLVYSLDEKKVKIWKTKWVVKKAHVPYVPGELVVGTTVAPGVVARTVLDQVAGTSINVRVKRKYRVEVLLRMWKATQGKEGFHSRAVAPIDDVFVLVPDRVKTILGLQKDAEVLKTLDTRDEKRKAVLDYMDEVDKLLTTGES